MLKSFLEVKLFFSFIYTNFSGINYTCLSDTLQQ